MINKVYKGRRKDSIAVIRRIYDTSLTIISEEIKENEGQNLFKQSLVFTKKTNIPETFKLIINKKEVTEYFKQPHLIFKVLRPFEITGCFCNLDLVVSGGGTNGQAEACRLAISRFLAKINPQYKAILKKSKFLKYDDRVVERKKTGCIKARKDVVYVRR